MRDPLDLPATPARLRVAAEAAGAPADAVQRALGIACVSPPPRAWIRFLTQALLLLGAGLLLSGVVCFFAFNWHDLGKFAKLGLLQLAIAACALIGWWRLRDFIGRVALSAAAVLVGPLLGVFGQTYQTGADPWGLFAAWALLTLPWAIVAHFTALWVLEVALADVALTLFWIQVPELDSSTWMYLFPLLAAIHIVAVAAWEWQRRRTAPWLDELWAPRLLVAGTFGFLLAPAIAFVFDITGEGRARTFGFFALWAAIAAAFVVYRRLREDLFMLTVAGGSVLIMLAVLLARLLFDQMKLETGGALIMALFVIGEVTLGVTWLRRTVRSEAE
jgi:uncharacterized membrane protein